MTATPPLLSVVIAWKDRSEIARALPRNADALNPLGAEVLIVNAGGNGEWLSDLVQDSGCDRLRVIAMPGVQTFNKSECLNVGGHFSRGTMVLVLDADTILSYDFLKQAVDEVKSGGCFVSLTELVEMSADARPDICRSGSFIRDWVATTEITLTDGRRASFEYRESPDGRRSGPGCVLARRQDFTSVQGFNSHIKGWGFEDYDFQIRLQFAAGLQRRTFGDALHISHPLVPNAANSSHRNTTLCTENYARGAFMGTLDADVARWSRRVVQAPLGLEARSA